MAFVLKAYEIRVAGYGPILYEGRTRGQAIAKAWRDFSEARGTSFKNFLKSHLTSARRVDVPEGFGEPILVSGMPAYRCLSKFGQYVRFARDDSEIVLLSHPADVASAPRRAP